MRTGVGVEDLTLESGRALRRYDVKIALALLGVAFIFVYYWPNIVIPIHSGEAGVLWSRIFGTQADVIYTEGTHLILPINQMSVYNVRYQTVERTFVVLSTDGLEMSVLTAIRFKPVDKLIGRLHKYVGPNYLETIVVPEVGTAVRETIGKFRPEQIYTTSFAEIQEDVMKLARPQILERFVLLDEVLLEKITLPRSVAEAIQHKLEEEQASLEMQYRISRETQEANRKRVEAQGIKDSQDIISSSLNDRLLQFKGIDATLELARSPNSKVVIVGGGKDGLPMILGSDAFTPNVPKTK